METTVDVDVSLDEVQEEQTSNQLETFQSQLVQALELNDKLIEELRVKEKEISVFKEIKNSLDSVVQSKEEEISALKYQLEVFKAEKFQDRISTLATKWVKRYNLTDDKLPEITTMLSKFQSEEELQKMETLIGLTQGKEKSSPVPVTQNSSVLVEQFAAGPNYESLNPDEKMKVLLRQLERFKQLKTQ
jgi:hypothetical protein